MRIAIRHELTVSPVEGAASAVQQVLLTAQSGSGQTVEDWTIDMPGIEGAAQFTDAYGNVAHLVNQTRPDGGFTVTVTGTATTNDRNGVLGRAAGEPVPALYRRVTALTRPPVTLYGKFRHAERHGPGRIATLHALMARVHETVGQPLQEQRIEAGEMVQSQSLAAPDPSARAVEMAHAFVGSARALDIPARFVTGYLAADDEAPAAFHAWAEAHDDGLGWIGFDPVLNLCPTDRHVRLAAGLDAHATTPIRIVPAATVETRSVAATAA